MLRPAIAIAALVVLAGTFPGLLNTTWPVIWTTVVSVPPPTLVGLIVLWAAGLLAIVHVSDSNLEQPPIGSDPSQIMFVRPQPLGLR